MVRYFAYGSNMLTKRLQSRCASAKFKHVAIADNWSLTFSKRSQDGSGKATVSESVGHHVSGVVFDLDESDLPELDRIEGVRSGYDRRNDFLVRDPKSQEQQKVVTYVAKPCQVDINLQPFDWYLSLVVVGARQHKLAKKYVERLVATPSNVDPNDDRPSRREALAQLGLKRLSDDTKIAGTKTVADWSAMRSRLAGSSGPEIWDEAFSEFFVKRLESRYFKPIKAIEKLGCDLGEGFAIVALHCSLIEFLSATLEGLSFWRPKDTDLPLGPFEYSDSRDMFVKFLEDNDPFKKFFAHEGSALDFYKCVRCGLVHEARTKGPWRIRVDEPANLAIDANAKVVYRDKMQPVFDEFVKCYGKNLRKDVALQQAFIRKIDSLCEE